MMITNQVLKQVFEKLKLPLEFENDFKNEAEILSLKKNDFFIREGEVCSCIGIVKSGSLYSFFEDDNTDIQVNELYQASSFISSYRSFLSQTPSPANFKANMDSEIYVIPYEKYLKLQKSIDWLTFFKAFSDTLFVRKCLKETALMNFSTKKRYELLIEQRHSIEQLFPQYIIASYLKMRPETLSRLKSLDLHQEKV